MTVDFGLKRAPAMRIASIRWNGPYNERQIRSRFEEVAKWARLHGARTGRWVFREPGSRTWVTGIEVKGPVRSDRRVKVRTVPASWVGSVVFDPEVVSPRIVYHGLSDWLRWQKREKVIRSVVAYREVYQGNPWTDRKAWASTEVQFTVRK